MPSYADRASFRSYDDRVRVRAFDDRTIFRSYSDRTFTATPGWRRLSFVLGGDGGAFGLYGPRGSGKSWAMLQATRQADSCGGMGLWFPCPSEYAEASEFLSALSDNLASAVEQRFLRWGRRRRAERRLARQATALRERIKYTATLHRNVQASVSGVYHATGSMQASRGRDLSERPTTVASLVFDFRRLAEAIATVTGQRLVIAIDELDKIGDPEQARKLLRDIKGIFEVPGVFFLVSVSEEAARTLQLGALQGTGHNEFNSSFYSVIEMPPLTPHDVKDIAMGRGRVVRSALAELLCLLSAGNLRELIRLAELWPTEKVNGDAPLHDGDCRLARDILAGEAATLWREVVRVCGPTADQLLQHAWEALPEDYFGDPDKFDALSRSAIHDFWNLGQQDPAWTEKVSGRWQRFLIRMFVVATAISPSPAVANAVASTTAICDLRNVLIMAGHSTQVALLMLRARFGEDLSSPYAEPPSRSAGPFLPACLLRYLGVVLGDGVRKGGCCAHIRLRGERNSRGQPFAEDGPALPVRPLPGGSLAAGPSGGDRRPG